MPTTEWIVVLPGCQIADRWVARMAGHRRQSDGSVSMIGDLGRLRGRQMCLMWPGFHHL
jgi:hypothetical protein